MSGERGATTRTAQISPDRFGVGVATIVLVAVVMLSSMVFSYVAIAEAAIWTHAPFGMHWLAPIFIDGAIITYTVALAVFEARREDRRTIVRTRAVLWGFAIFSVAINFAHAGSGWGWSYTSLEAWFGYLIAMSAPIAALLSAEAVVQLAFKHRRVVDEQEEAAVPATPAVEPEQAEVADSAPAIVESDQLAVLEASLGDDVSLADVPVREQDLEPEPVAATEPVAEPLEPVVDLSDEPFGGFDDFDEDNLDAGPPTDENAVVEGEYVRNPTQMREFAESGVAVF